MRRFIINFFSLLFGLMLGCFSTWSSAVDGCYYHDVCYADSNNAIQSFSGSFPLLIGTAMHIYWSTDTIAGCDFSYTTASYNSFGQIAFFPSQSAFVACIVPEDVSSLVPNNFILVCVVVILWAVGFSVGQKR